MNFRAGGREAEGESNSWRRAALVCSIVSCAPAALAAQAINFTSELPRTLVFIQEEDQPRVAFRDVVAFLRAASFPLIDPALVNAAAPRAVLQSALSGNEEAAIQLGRDFGAHLLVLGKADWDSTLDNSTGKRETRTAQIELRAIRLDAGKVVATARGRGSAIDASGPLAGARAVRYAINEIVQRSEFVGAVVNNWDEEPWSGSGYFQPDPGSLRAALQPLGLRGPLQMALLRTDVSPSAGAAPRGRGVLNRARGSGVTNDVRIEGIVVGRVASVEVKGRRVDVTRLDAMEARKLGLDAPAFRFSAALSLSSDEDSVPVTAIAPNGEATTMQAAPRIAQKWAVIVGVGNYRNSEISDVRFAARDAQAVYDFLRSSSAGPFQEDHVLFLKDEQATTRALREALFVFLQKASADDLVLIYFAGHGVPDPTRPDNLYLLPHDADLSALATSGLPMWDVKTALRRHIKAERVILIADACHAGGVAQGAANPINRAFEDLFTPSRRLLLIAGHDHEPSHEDVRWGGGHGVFTYNLIEGLKGAADSDRNGIVTFAEVADYVSGKVRLETNGRQSPQRVGLGDIPLAEVPALASWPGAARR